MKKVLLIGGAEFIGINITEYLIKAYHDAHIFILDYEFKNKDRTEIPPSLTENTRISYWRTNFSDKNMLSNLIKQSDTVINLLPMGDFKLEADNFSDFFSEISLILNIIRINPVERYIHVTDSGIYGGNGQSNITEDYPFNKESPVNALMAGIDMLVLSYYHKFGLPCVILRPFYLYGPYQNIDAMIPLFITCAINNRLIDLFCDISSTYDFIYINDFCKVLEKSLNIDIEKIKGEVINIGTGIGSSIGDLLKLILKKLKRSETLISFVEKEKYPIEKQISSCARAKVLLGWVYNTSLDKGIDHTISWYKKNL